MNKQTIYRNGYTGSLYLNNTGDKWVSLTNGVKDQITLKTETGKEVVRTVIYYESLGNFAVACISYKGKKITVFPDSILSDTLPDTVTKIYVGGRMITVPSSKAEEIKEGVNRARAEFITANNHSFTSESDFHAKVKEWEKDYVTSIGL